MIQVFRAESIQQLQTRRLKVQVYLLHEDFLQVSSQASQHRMGDLALLKSFRH